MKINPTQSCLSLVLHAINTAVLPEVTSKSAVATLGLITATLTDLLKRQGPSVELLKRCNENGRKLGQEVLGVLFPSILFTSRVFEDEPPNTTKEFEQLCADHDHLTRELDSLCILLSQRNDEVVANLLRLVAEWELGYYQEVQKLKADMFSNDKLLEEDIAALSPDERNPKPAPKPFSRDSLQEFLRKSRGTPLDVIEFSQMTGGYGKQTYQCLVKHEGIDEPEDLIIRKCDANPIIEYGGFRVEQEFELVRVLESIGFPTPKPLELGHDIPGADGSFYTMTRLPGHIPCSFLGISEMEFSEKLLLRLAELLGQLHAIPLSNFEGFIAKFEEPGTLSLTIEELYRRNINNWRQYVQRVEHLASPYLTWLFHWLEKNIPHDTRPIVLTHGDFNFHNIMISSSADDVTGVLDWECSDFGAPEQDIVYVQSVVTRHMSWDRFLDRYIAHGGVRIRPENFAFCQAYSVLRTMIAFNRATLMNQRGYNTDIRFMMVTFGINAAFMGMGLNYTAGEFAASGNTDVESESHFDDSRKSEVLHAEDVGKRLGVTMTI